MRILKRGAALCLFLCMAMAVLVPAAASADLNAENIIGTTWYGGFYSVYYGTDQEVRNSMNLTIESCGSDGSFTASGMEINTEGADRWAREQFEGTIDFSTGAFDMRLTRILEDNPAGNWHITEEDHYIGSISVDGIRGYFAGTSDRTFYFARTSPWAQDEVTDANTVGLIPETIQGKDLTQNITRAEFAAVSARLYESLAGREIAPYQGYKFSDIAGNDNETYIRKAYAVNIAVGVADDLFAPDAKLTREEMATMLTRVIKKYKFADWTLDADGEYYLDTSGVKRFADDGQISDWARPSVYYLYKLEIVKGVDDVPNFAPRAVTPEQEARDYATATREQAILMALRVYKISEMI